MHLRAHSAWRQTECAGSTAFVTDIETEYGRHDIPEAKAGSDLHQLVEDVLNGKVVLDDVQGDDKQHIERCVEFVKRWAYEGGETEVVFELHEDGEKVVGCRADYVTEMDDAVMVVDWKFYRDPLERIETEHQMMVTVCAAAMRRGVNHGYAKLYLPILDLTYEYEVEDVLQTYTTVILPAWEILNEKTDLTAGPWCARCPVLGRCPSAQQTMQSVAASANLGAIWTSKELPTVKVMVDSLYEGLKTASPAKFRGVLEWLPVVPAFEKAVKRLLREQLEADPASHPGWELKSKNLPATGDAKVLEEVTEDYLDDGEFDDCRKLSVAQLRDVLVERLVSTGQVNTKKAGFFAVEALLGPHLTVKTTKELRRKKL